MADDQGEKTEEPSQYKLEKARQKGDVASSREVNSVLVLTSCFVVIFLSSAYFIESFSDYIHWLYRQRFNDFFKEEFLEVVLQKTFWAIAKIIAPVFAVSFIFGVLSQIGQVGLLYAPEVLEVKLERLNPLEGIKKIFSKKAIAETVKGLLKLVLIIAPSVVILKNDIHKFQGILHLEPSELVYYGSDFLLTLSLTLTLGLIIVAIFDVAWEKYSYREKHKMTKQQVKEEMKEREGSPEVRQRIKSIQREMALKRAMEDLKEANVVITNPTHYSVAIKYDGQGMHAPMVVTKGKDFLALRIRERAKELGIPIVENVPLARRLYKDVQEREFVPRSVYRAVAEVLAYVYKLRKKV